MSTQRRGGQAGTRKASTRLLPPELVLPPPRRLVGFVRLAWDTRAGSEGPWVSGNSRGTSQFGEKECARRRPAVIFVAIGDSCWGLGSPLQTRLAPHDLNIQERGGQRQTLPKAGLPAQGYLRAGQPRERPSVTCQEDLP